ncbi:uncharacterized protein LY89DRAFT_737737 [Mollisia scopiformis]|uniref:Protein kinase domain-containing protein n=1 Tax=Mollisia scopiformis TaxID=149040 RepID=A0A194WY24_MOLSC|nr:uncharacterized protein LY89DRAFT_737737 [Mollisia scopiformis]KUJ12830.1 hypothetical protein LY89DRAFT_737737 [Mollisia scopiformis]
MPNDELMRLVDFTSVLTELIDDLSMRYKDPNVHALAESISQTAPRLFAALVYSDLRHYVLVFHNAGLNDEDMPFTISSRIDSSTGKEQFQLRSSKSERAVLLDQGWRPDLLNAFLHFQWVFNAPIFECQNENQKLYGDVPHWTFDQHCILPFVDETEIPNNFGRKMWSVIIDPAHQLLYRDKQDPNPAIVIMKFIGTETDFQHELSVLKCFISNDQNPRLHLQRLLASYYYRQAYYFMFLMADGSLRDYWNCNPKPEFSSSTISWVLTQCCGIAQALRTIQEPKTGQPGWYGILQPETILWISKDSKGKGQHGYSPIEQLVIADLNFSYPDGWSRRSKSRLRGHIPSQYAAPELASGLEISPSYDIWSLGCLYLEMITWLLGGCDFLHLFAARRNKHDHGSQSQISKGSFYTIVEDDGKLEIPRNVIVLPEVVQWVMDLRKSPLCSKFLNDFLNLICDYMLVTYPRGRMQAAHLSRQLSSIRYEAANAIKDSIKPLDLEKLPEVRSTKSPSSPAGRDTPPRTPPSEREPRPFDFYRIAASNATLINSTTVFGSSPQNLESQINYEKSIIDPEPSTRVDESSLGGEKSRGQDGHINSVVYDPVQVYTRGLDSALASGNLESVLTFLSDHFELMAKGDYVWLLELRDHGYTVEEISRLLIDERQDSPWIFFQPSTLPKLSTKLILDDYHQPSCVHMIGQDLGGHSDVISYMDASDPFSQLMELSSDESTTLLEELCGLAGVVPDHRNGMAWTGSVRFEKQDNLLTASVSYRRNDDEHSLASLAEVNPFFSIDTVDRMYRMIHVLSNLCSGIAHAQRRGLCCDSFTFLFLQSGGLGRPIIELCHLKVMCASMLLEGLRTLRTENILRLPLTAMEDVKGFTREIFHAFDLVNFSAITEVQIVDHASLAIQFLSLAFASYLKAHTSPFQPFFLDSPLQSIELFGSQDLSTGRPSITASFYQFTCLHEMLQEPVLVFKEGRVEQPTGERYDLSCFPEDLVDTWGPSQFIPSNNAIEATKGELVAVVIGGGVIKPTDSTLKTNKIFHWSKDIDPRHDSLVRFTRGDKITVAGVVRVNGSCQSNPIQRWSSFISSFENLGTTPGYWQFTEFQAGISLIGQQFAGAQLQFNKTWTWHPGNSWKHQYLGLMADDLPLAELDRPWGILVSACTGVARRVPLRVLLADVLPAFASNLTSTPKAWAKLQPGIVKALQESSSHVKQWHDDLCNQPDFQEIQNFSRRLIRHILLVLRDTGIDREHKTFRIACPQGHNAAAPITMCLPVPCEKACLWAQILTDTENCATFACMTTQCLESQEHKCQTTTPWHCPSLDTAVQQLRAHKDPILLQPQTWRLIIDALYWIGSPESGLQAKVLKSATSPIPRLHISKGRIPQKTRARLGAMMSKRDRLRERQIDTWPAEDVLVLS